MYKSTDKIIQFNDGEIELYSTYKRNYKEFYGREVSSKFEKGNLMYYSEWLETQKRDWYYQAAVIMKNYHVFCDPMTLPVDRFDNLIHNLSKLTGTKDQEVSFSEALRKK